MVNFKNKFKESSSQTGSGWQLCRRLTMAIAMVSLFAFASFADVYTGYVTDENDEPVIGATVVQKNKTTNGTSTDIDGKFELNVEGSTATLLIQYIGHQDQTVKAKAGQVVRVKLAESATNLEDVVVVAYGQQKKTTVTGSVATVDNRDIKKSSAARLDNALQGRITGLVSFQNGGGQPGVDGATMFLRGVSSNINQSPLILVDGVERDVIGQLDPNEVENVSVLKDASATAVFGVRGANGVILITTKRGHDGRPDLNISFEQSWTSFTKKDTRIHAIEWMKVRNEALENDGLEHAYSDDVIEKFQNKYWGLDPNAADYEQQKKWRDYMYPDHYWVKELFRDTTPQSKVNINMAGGTDKFKYFINVGYIHQGGNTKNEKGKPYGFDPSVKSDQWKFRSNLDYDINKYFKASLSLSTYIRQNNQPNANAMYGGDLNWAIRDMFNQATTMPPIYAGPLTIKPMNPENETEEGLVIQPKNYDRSPYLIMNRMGYAHGTTVKMTTNFALSYDLSKVVTKGLNIRGSISYDANGTRNRGSNCNQSVYNVNQDYENAKFDYALNGDLVRTYSLWSGSSSDYTLNMQAQLNYNRQFGSHDVGAMVLAQRDYSVPGDWRPHNVIGVATRFTYGYDSRYLLEFDLGYNGSEQFAPSNRFGTFPAFSAGWIISNEKFMASTKSWLDNLKVRGSWGRVGSDGYTGSSSRRFLYMDNISFGTSQWASGLGTGSVRSISISKYANPNLKWETADKFDIGFDIGVLKCLTLTMDYYKEKRKDILINRNSVPVFQGTPLGTIPMYNMGRIDNNGLEFELGFNKNVAKDLNINAKVNWGTNHNIVKDWDEAERDESYPYRYRTEGYPLGQCWGYKIDYSSNDGFFVSKEDVEHYGQTYNEATGAWEGKKITYASGSPRPGDFKYVDLNGDGVIDDHDVMPLKHSTTPGITWGCSLGLDYKNVDFAIFFAGLGRFSQNYSGQNVYEVLGAGCYYEYQRTAWTAERWANGDKITYPALSTTTSVSLRANDFFTMKRSYTRLKNLIIGYTLPRTWLKAVGVKSLRVYASGENLFVWDSLRMKHIDPEQADAIGYPITKNMTVGVNVNF